MSEMDEPMWDCNQRKHSRPITEGEAMWLALQVFEDTCLDHNEFCCPICFDMTPVESE